MKFWERVSRADALERLGSSPALRTDARLIAATNRDLGAMVGGLDQPSLITVNN